MRTSLSSRRFLWLIGVASVLVAAGVSRAAGNPDVAALQVGLRARNVYVGTIDGLFGNETSAAVRELQLRAGLPATGAFGPGTRRLLGAYARPTVGSRILTRGMSGWDVAALQFLLAWHGFPSGYFDGVLGPQTQAALIRFQRWARLLPDAIAGPAVLAALRSPPLRSPIALAWPLQLPIGDRFGPRGSRFHAAIDFPAPPGVRVRAAAGGRVVYAGWRAGGWGREVTVAHGLGVRSLYAHLSSVSVRVGERVKSGATVGLVGATGDASGPHLHFEVRLRGAVIDPLSTLGPRSASAPAGNGPTPASKARRTSRAN